MKGPPPHLRSGRCGSQTSTSFFAKNRICRKIQTCSSKNSSFLSDREWRNRLSLEELLHIDGVNLSGDLHFDGFDGKHLANMCIFE